MFDKIKNIIEAKKKPRHIGIMIDGNITYAKKNHIEIKEIFKASFQNIISIVNEQIKQEIPVITFNIMSQKLRNSDNAHIIIDEMILFFDQLINSTLLDDNQIKVSIFGKWYEMSGLAIEKIKQTIDMTKDYDKYFVNFCINYDGYEELVDACKIIGRKISAGKLEPDSITKETIKENIYNSFMRPDLIIKTGRTTKLKGFMMWDSGNSKVHFTRKSWQEFDRKEFGKIIENY